MNSAHDIKTGRPKKTPETVSKFDWEFLEWGDHRSRYKYISPIHANCKWLVRLNSGKGGTRATLPEAVELRDQLLREHEANTMGRPAHNHRLSPAARARIDRDLAYRESLHKELRTVTCAAIAGREGVTESTIKMYKQGRTYKTRGEG